MKQLLLASLIALSLTACQKAPAPETAAPAADTAAPAAEPTGESAPAAAEASAIAASFNDQLSTIAAGPQRSAENIARNAFRHPVETLTLFGLAPTMNIIEIAPGGGWYTEILAPAVSPNGSYTAIVVDPAKTTSDRAKEYNEKANQGLRDKFAAAPDQYGTAKVLAIDPAAPVLGEANSADMVLTFRNVHGWAGAGTAEQMFKAFFDVLKPGGVLGIEQHRAAPGTDPTVTAKSGYVSEDYVVGLAKAAGFELAERSEINANPKDDKDHPNGVWSLPPNLDVPEADKAAFSEIGESDRMTLKFVKPAA